MKTKGKRELTAAEAEFLHNAATSCIYLLVVSVTQKLFEARRLTHEASSCENVSDVDFLIVTSALNNYAEVSIFYRNLYHFTLARSCRFSARRKSSSRFMLRRLYTASVCGKGCIVYANSPVETIEHSPV